MEADHDHASGRATVPEVSPHVPSTEAPFALGEVVGGVYELVAVLGQGGMGTVYEAEDRVLSRRVALKVAFLGSDALEREGRALAVLRHPGIPTIFAAGSHRGHRYLVMERLKGRSLEQRIEETLSGGHRFTIAEVLSTLRRIADALSAAHGVGVAHRDLKPANVMVCGKRLVLVDFGLFVPEYDAERDPHIVGSIEYMAPEVLTKSVKAGEGPAIDLYALGVVGFELLTGRTPYGTSSPSRVVTGHVLGAIPDVRELRPETPLALAHLIRELLEKRPEDRPDGAEAVVWRLANIAGEHASHRARPTRVFLVDDDPDVLHILERSLRAALPGLEVESFLDAVAALERIDATHVDVVLVDLEMTAMNGIELAMAVAAIPDGRRPRIVALTEAADERDLALFRALGVWDFVPKDGRFVTATVRILGELRRSLLPP